jgi:multiple sugar transport system permease protein
LLTGGRANTTPVVMAIFNISFGRFQLGTGAAMSVVLLITVVIISGVQLLILKDQSEGNE